MNTRREKFGWGDIKVGVRVRVRLTSPFSCRWHYYDVFDTVSALQVIDNAAQIGLATVSGYKRAVFMRAA